MKGRGKTNTDNATPPIHNGRKRSKPNKSVTENYLEDKKLTIGNLIPIANKPLYQQIKQFIYENIASSAWLPGDKIPSDSQLINKFNVSRMTVIKAIKELVLEGHLVRIHGVGTFVAKDKPELAGFEVKSIADEIKQWGGKHSSIVHLLEKERAHSLVAESFQLPIGSTVYHSVIVHFDHDIPVQLADQYVNPSVVPDYIRQDFANITPHDYLKGVPLTEAEHIIEAILPDRTAQQLLNIEAGEPCILIRRRTFAMKTVSTSSRLIYPGSRFRLGARFIPGSTFTSKR